MFLAINAKKSAPLILALILMSACFFLTGGDGSAVEADADDGRPVLIIDAGHGGEDGGAVGAGGLTESYVNLAVAQRLEALAGLMGVPTVMTRIGDDIAYPDTAKTTAARKKADQRARVELINSIPNGVLMSVHQNCFPSAKPSGPQVLYAGTEGSADLGKLAHELLNAAICPENRRVAAPISDGIYLMKNVKCPAILAECGFISNQSDAEKLQTDGYQIKISAALLAAYLRFTAEDMENA